MAEVVTVQAGGFEVTTNASTADEVIETLRKPDSESSPEPVEIKGGKPVDRKATPSERGKKGGEATAAIKRKEAREAEKPTDPGADIPGGKVDVSEAKPKGDSDVEAGGEAAAKAKDDSEAEPKGKPRNDPEARVRQALTRVQEAEERARLAEETLRFERRQRQASGADREPQKAPEQPQAAKKPNINDFDDLEKYFDARDKWVEEQADARHAEQERRRAHLTGIKTVMDRFGEELGDDGFGEQPAFAKPTFLLKQGEERTPLTDAMAEIMVHAKNKRAVIEKITGDEKTYQRIAALQTPSEVTREIARLDAQVQKAPDAATAGTSSGPTVSRAHPPARPVAGTPTTAPPNVTDPSLDFDRFARLRQAQG